MLRAFYSFWMMAAIESVLYMWTCVSFADQSLLVGVCEILNLKDSGHIPPICHHAGRLRVILLLASSPSTSEI